MSEPRPDSLPETTDPDGTPVENPSGSTFSDQTGPGEALELNSDLPLVNPVGD